jgi:general secretion pathway protein G
MRRTLTAFRARRSVRHGADGFTLLELIVVIAIVGILAAMAVANLKQTPRRAKEAVLKTNLRTLREVIDQFYADQGTYPPTLEDLVSEGYLRKVPIDPITGADDWNVVFENEVQDDLDDGGGFDDWDDFDDVDDSAPGIIDVHSSSPDNSLDGEPYAEW